MVKLPGWGLERLNVSALWASGLTGQKLRIAHLDTGLAGHLPSLAGRVAAFRHFHLNGWSCEEGAPLDSATHGTQTAALLVGGAVDGLPLGVAPGAQLASGLVIEGGQNLLRVLMGLAWVATLDVRVACLSLGIPGGNPVFNSMLAHLQAHGILVVAPVGNGGAGRAHAPGSAEQVLTVGAVDFSGRVAPFSGSLNSHDGLVCHKPDLLAPGVEVSTLSPSGALVRASGTSLAAAYVAGLALLLFQSRPQAGPQEVAAALVQSAGPLPDGQTHRSRAGLTDAPAALAALHSSQGEAPPPTHPQDEGDRYLDARLVSRLKYSAEDAELTVLVVSSASACPEEVLGEIGRRCGSSPARVVVFPDRRTAALTAPRPFIRFLMEHEQIRIVSAPDTAV